MREIKFRALFELQEGGTEWRTTGINEFHGDKGDKQISPWLQFTGLTDKNGVDIYEGDIMEYKSQEQMVVIWHPKFASFGLRKEGWLHTHFFGEAIEDSDKCEVIGNIHQHPNLLTKK